MASGKYSEQTSETRTTYLYIIERTDKTYAGKLCGSHRLRKQPAHSFKLQLGLGWTPQEFIRGACSLDSLLM